MEEMQEYRQVFQRHSWQSVRGRYKTLLRGKPISDATTTAPAKESEATAMELEGNGEMEEDDILIDNLLTQQAKMKTPVKHNSKNQSPIKIYSNNQSPINNIPKNKSPIKHTQSPNIPKGEVIVDEFGFSLSLTESKKLFHQLQTLFPKLKDSVLVYALYVNSGDIVNTIKYLEKKPEGNEEDHLWSCLEDKLMVIEKAYDALKERHSDDDIDERCRFLCYKDPES